MFQIYSIVFSPDGRKLAGQRRDTKDLVICDAATGEELRNIRGATGSIRALAFHPSGDRLVVASNDLRVFELSHGQMSRAVDGFVELDAADHSGLVFSRDSSRLIGIGVTGWNSDHKHATWQLKSWDADTGVMLSAIDLPPTPEYIWQYGKPAVNRSGSLGAIPVGPTLTLYRTTSGH